jgi:hypothetical protein
VSRADAWHNFVRTIRATARSPSENGLGRADLACWSNGLDHCSVFDRRRNGCACNESYLGFRDMPRSPSEVSGPGFASKTCLSGPLLTFAGRIADDRADVVEPSKLELGFQLRRVRRGALHSPRCYAIVSRIMARIASFYGSSGCVVTSAVLRQHLFQRAHVGRRREYA